MCSTILLIFLMKKLKEKDRLLLKTMELTVHLQVEIKDLRASKTKPLPDETVIIFHFL